MVSNRLPAHMILELPYFLGTCGPGTEVFALFSYLIDFEHFDTPSSKSVTWRDRNYLAWNLAQAPNFADFDDMSTWIL